MAGFGIGTDYLGLSSADLILIESNNTPKSQTREQAQDEDGNFAAEDQYDGSGAEAVECVYELQSGTLNLNTLTLGHVSNGGSEYCFYAIEVSTSNGEWPKLRCSAYKDVTSYANYPAFTLPSCTISGKKQAQGLLFAVGSNCRLTSSTLSCSGEFAYTLDSAGDVGADAFSGADLVVSGEAVEIEGAVTWTPDTGQSFIETQAPGGNTTNISWATTNFEAGEGLTPDT
jgi:hypothetical protein